MGDEKRDPLKVKVRLRDRRFGWNLASLRTAKSPSVIMVSFGIKFVSLYKQSSKLRWSFQEDYCVSESQMS